MKFEGIGWDILRNVKREHREDIRPSIEMFFNKINVHEPNQIRIKGIFLVRD